MTREEAKNWLRKLYARADITDEYGDMEDMQPYEEAINMAISALSAEPCDDCISRKAVLELATPYDSMYADITVEMISAADVKKLPSVQPVIPNMTITVDDSYMRNVRRDCGLHE